MSFNGVDFLDLDPLLDEEELLVRNTVRNFVEIEISPIISEYYEEGKFPEFLIPKLGELGVLGANLPEEYGCAGMNNISYGLIMQELEACDSGIRSFVSVQGALCMYPIYAFGSEVQKHKYLKGMAQGKIIGCFGLTEPNFGSNPGDMLTKAEKVTGGWLINGAKAWITNGSIADIAIVWAKLDNEVRGFIVEKNTKGFSTRITKNKLSLRASITSELHFDNCYIPEDNILEGSKGLKSPLMCLSQARYGIAWGAVGAAMSCYETALKYAQQRVQFGKPIAGFQLTQEKLVNMITEIIKPGWDSWVGVGRAVQCYVRELEYRIVELQTRLSNADGLHAQDLAQRDKVIAAQQHKIKELTQQLKLAEEKLRLSSHNSSQPPSADAVGKANRRERPLRGKRRGGQTGHPFRARRLTPVEGVTSITDHRPERCVKCNGRLSGDDAKPLRNQIIEIPVAQPQVFEHRLHSLQCTCGHITRACLPEGITAKGFGPGVEATVATLASGADCRIG